MKNKKILTISVILVIFSVFLITLIYLSNSLKPVSNQQNKISVKIEIPDNLTVKKVAKILKQNNLIKNDKIFYLAARFPVLTLLDSFKIKRLNLKSGVYNINNSMSVSEIFELLSSGIQDFIVVSFPEGLTISKIAAKLQEKGVCSSEDFEKACFNKELLNKMNIESESFEGYLFPDTYYFTPKMSTENVVQEMVKNLKNHLEKIPQAEGLTPKEINQKIILASIIEREYRIPEEAPLISSVFTNRLKINMGLYSCATIEYIITEIQKRPHPGIITYEELKIDNPYNTYKWAGLPPGAISNPGDIALKSAFNPEKTNYYYFTLIDAEKGKHSFSKDLQTHINKGFSFKTK